MANVTKAIRTWLGNATTPPKLSLQQAARDQLHGHITEALLEPFLRRTVTPEQHATVVAHLNACEGCRDAIALVLLARENPTAAAEMELERKHLAEDNEPWQRVAIRWTLIVLALIGIVTLLIIIPKADDPNSRIGRWVSSEAAKSAAANTDSDTSTGALIAATLRRERKPPRETPNTAPGWFSGPAPSAALVENTPDSEVPLPRRSESADQQSATSASNSDDGKSLWFFGEAQPSSNPNNTTPVWDPVLAAKRREEESGKGAGAKRTSSRRRLVVSPEGLLRRTLDGGGNWDILDVGRKVEFRTLALSGTTVWAAGSGGALYRSPDAADHWQAVTVRHRGSPLTADIEHIHFSDPQHGTFETSDGQIWITVDGGSKWVFNSQRTSR
ncbi:MAG TPA: YCF48-related protein [Terriglobales bacterium]|nr:YCF48-related protein [Terriglobales bacterium]